MSQRDSQEQNSRKGVILKVRVQPRANKNEIIQILLDGTVKVHLTAPPVEGKANKALLKFLAKILDVPIANIDIVAGMTGRDKVISVENMDLAMLHKKIVEHIR
jgi:uncharacterized protein (TIGR00251 family)